MKEFNEYFDTAMKFHGHKCPATPMGLRAGLAAMRTLGVERSQDKELFVEAETGEEDHRHRSLRHSGKDGMGADMIHIVFIINRYYKFINNRVCLKGDKIL